MDFWKISRGGREAMFQDISNKKDTSCIFLSSKINKYGI